MQQGSISKNKISKEKIQVRKEKMMKYKPKIHLWPLSRRHYKWRVQMTFLVSVTGLKLFRVFRENKIKKFAPDKSNSLNT